MQINFKKTTTFVVSSIIIIIKITKLSTSVFIRGKIDVYVVCESLPVALLKCGAELSPRPDFVGVREPLALRPLVHFVQRLLPLHGRHQLLHQLPAHVALAHVAFTIHVGVHADLRTPDLNGGVDLVEWQAENEQNSFWWRPPMMIDIFGFHWGDYVSRTVLPDTVDSFQPKSCSKTTRMLKNRSKYIIPICNVILTVEQ